MTLFRQKYRIESTRLAGWDYRAAGWYFITICTQGQACFLGRVVDGEMRLSLVGETAERYWADIPAHFTAVGLDAFVVMPNHLLGIVAIDSAATPGDERRLAANPIGADSPGSVETRHVVSLPRVKPFASPPPTGKFGPLTPGSLSAIVHAYKSAVTRRCRKHGHGSFSWQPRFYDRVIRDEASLNKIREYIVNSPAKWELDKYCPNTGLGRQLADG